MSGDDEKDLLIEANRSIVDRQRHDNNIILTGGKWESTHDSARDFTCHRIYCNRNSFISLHIFATRASIHSFGKFMEQLNIIYEPLLIIENYERL
jgi:hypothetical protein